MSGSKPPFARNSKPPFKQSSLTAFAYRLKRLEDVITEQQKEIEELKKRLSV